MDTNKRNIIIEMKKQELVKKTLLRKQHNRFPVFSTETPQFLESCLKKNRLKDDKTPLILQKFQYYDKLDMDIIQIGHPSFYPTRLDLPRNTKYTD